MKYFPRILFGILAGFCFLGAYSLYIEPVWLETTEHELLGKVRAPLKVIHLTDLHLRHIGRLEKSVLQVIEDQNPDLIVLTGDDTMETTDPEELGRFFRALHAPLGVWSIKGNWENWVPNDDSYEKNGVRQLVNEERLIREDVSLVGFDDRWTGSPDRELVLESGKRFRLALFHAPEFFEEVAGFCDLALAGHTHGGQIRFPIIGAPWLPPGSQGFEAGWFKKKQSQMYVSRGLGTSIIRARFLARPELPIIKILPDPAGPQELRYSR